MCHLNAFLALLAVVLSLGTSPAQPTKALTGRLLDDHLEGVPRANICARDRTIIGTTDMEGYFKVDVPVNTNTLIFMSVGMEWNTVNLSADCLNLEVILLLASSYDFMSVRRVNRQEFKRFKHLPTYISKRIRKAYLNPVHLVLLPFSPSGSHVQRNGDLNEAKRLLHSSNHRLQHEKYRLEAVDSLANRRSTTGTYRTIPY
jgi:hypothetical protein